MKKDPNIRYWKHAEVPLPPEQVSEERRRLIRDAEAAVTKAEQAVEKAQKRLKRAIDCKMVAYRSQIPTTEWKYVECEEDEACWMLDQTGTPLKFRNQFGEWTSC